MGTSATTDALDERRRVERYLRALLVVELFFGLSLGGISLGLGVGWAGQIAGLIALFLPIILIGRRLVQRGRFETAVLLVAPGFALVAFGVGLIAPPLIAPLAIVPLSSMLIALPYVRPQRIRALCAILLLGDVLLVVNAQLHPMMLEPRWLPPLLMITGVPAAVLLVLIPWWEQLSRLNTENRRLETRVESALDSVRAREELVSVASHELRTPLTPVLLGLRALEDRIPEIVDDREARSWMIDRVSLLQRSAKRLTRLVDELLDLSRTSSDQVELHSEELDLAGTVHGVALELEDEVARAGSTLVLDLDRPVPGTWDGLRIEQVVSNLISNAIKYGAPRPVTVRLRRGHESAVLSVVDEGCGIAPEDHERIFQAFQRTRTTRESGLGLGLYITRKIVTLMGGEIHVDSARGRGATFTVSLPLRPRKASVASA